jgi:hypothetical protein
MSRDVEAKNDRLYDKRTVERSIKKGLLTRKDYEKHLKGLDDVAPKGVFGGPEEGALDDDDDDEDEDEPGGGDSGPGASE